MRGHYRRHSSSEPRIELIPLIDVMMFLLTFFLYAFLMIVRINVLPMELQEFASSRPAQPKEAVVIHIDLAGKLQINDDPIAIDDVLGRLLEARDRNPDTEIYLALADGVGSTDRAPLLTELWDRLKDAGLKINFVGRPKEK